MGAMDEDTSKLYIQNLEEYVLDEEKIVTYKWLSRELNLHVNLAKQLLHTFLKQHEKVVHATYLLSGLLQDEVTHKVLIVQEDDLEKAKSQFKRLSSEHVYSVQKAKQIADLNSLYIIDRYNKNDSDIKRLNAIHCNEAVERAADEIAKLKIKARAASVPTDAKAWPAAKAKATTQANKETDNAAIAPEDKAEAKKDDTLKKKEKKSGGIAAMFAAQSSKNQKQETTTEKTKANAKPAPKAKSNIAMFFNKNSEKPKEKSKPPEPPATKDENSDSGFDSKESQPMSDDEDQHKECVKDETKTPESKVNTKGKSKPDPIQKEKKVNSVKRSAGKAKNKRKVSDDPPTSKKRKRIVCVSDSEDSDDDIFGKDEEDEDETPNSPMPVPAPAPLVESDEEVIPPTPRDDKRPGRKRERKLKTSTFMDEDGYVVTKREYVVESCTDSEGEDKKENMKTKDNNSEKVKDEKKSPTSEPPTKKKCSPQKVKQATLMNFFKKK